MGVLTPHWLSRHFTQSGWEGWGDGACVHISKISSATIFPPYTGLTHPPQLTLSHDRDLKYTTGSGSSDSLLCSVSQTGVEWGQGESQTERERERVIRRERQRLSAVLTNFILHVFCSMGGRFPQSFVVLAFV